MKTIIVLIAFLLFLHFAKPVLAAIAGDIVINEVYYDVDSSHGLETSNEWIELYNKSASAIDVSGWTIADNLSVKTIGSDTQSIPANGIMLISPDSSTWGYWSINEGIIKLIMPLGNGLSNSGDKLALKDNLGNEIDAISYGVNVEIWNPAAEDVSEGHSLERNPGGKDTNSSSDFIDQESPSPGVIIAEAATPTPVPTNTPIPTSAPTSTPVPTPTPTKTPTPTPIPTPTPTKTPTPTVKPASASVTPASNNATDEAIPTSVLNDSTESEITDDYKTSQITPAEKTKILGVQTNSLSKILIGIGAIFLVSCGVLFFRSYISNKKQQEV